MVLVRQGMAYAGLAGLLPVTGLYMSILCLLCYAVSGPSQVLVPGLGSSLGLMIAATILPLTGAEVLMVMRARCESGTGFDVVLDIVVPRACDGPVARNDLAWLVGLGGRRALGGARHQRRRRLQQVLGELPLAGKQLLGKVIGAGHGALWLGLQQVLGELPLAGKQLLAEFVGAGHGVLWPGQLVREGHTDGRQLGTGCPDGSGQVPDHGDHGLLALTRIGPYMKSSGAAARRLG